jgi:ABC-2 type transport system permease protein
VFSLVFTVVLDNDIPSFPVYLLSGLLAWNLFGTSLGLAARSVVDNGNLVTKVYFPREILPLSSVGTAMVDFGLQALVLAVFMVAFGYDFFGPSLLLLPLALVALLAFTGALGIWVAALNVRYRDTQHLLGLSLLAWFWLTPIVYPSGFAYGKLAERELLGIPLWNIFLANPMADIVMGFQRALYATVRPIGSGGEPVLVLAPVSLGWLAVVLGVVAAGSLVLLFMAWRTFFHLSGDFAEEL